MDSWEENLSDNTRKLQEFYNQKIKPPQDYYFEENKAPVNAGGGSGSPLPSETLNAVLSTIGSLAEFIPGIGGTVSKGLTVVNMFLEPPKEDESSKTIEAMTKLVQNLEKNIKSFIDDDSFLKEDAFYKGCGDQIRGWQEEGVFEMVDMIDQPRMTEVAKELHSHTGSITPTSFANVLNTIRAKYTWGQTKRITLLLGLMTMYANCMELEAILQANFSLAYEKAGKTEEAKQCRKAFYGKLKEMHIFLKREVKLSIDWAATKRSERLEKVPRFNRQTWMDPPSSTNSHREGNKMVYNQGVVAHVAYEESSYEKKTGYQRGSGGPWGSSPGAKIIDHHWKSEDQFSKRVWEISAREYNVSGRSYDAECKQLFACMQLWKQYYIANLEEHIQEQFAAVDTAMKTWTVFCKKLEEWYTVGIDKTYTKRIDGVVFYRRLCKGVDNLEEEEQVEYIDHE
ncbi:hypothetical protein EJ08DRAFT_645364 [Tothia fuscella]|uniref:Uncharacterized protein n=1 Tax=Tothia fuscella TaxID=1048955 RepID=A0A9P4P2M2_9PEZI|nr:hypothetical protein EJ08DRAFT_645364 [Tothia fuscella]